MGWDHSTITYDTLAVSFLKIVKPEIRNPKLEIRRNEPRTKFQIPIWLLEFGSWHLVFAS
jgi:hypothetical protein